MSKVEFYREVLRRLNPREWVTWVYRESDEGHKGRYNGKDRRSEQARYTVGYWRPDGRWYEDSRHKERGGAAARVRELNGSHSEKLRRPRRRSAECSV